ncbi:hypothetical protein QYE76_048384 [Lolium multiflorum]|uniref:Retrotransposon gag domain-containing protein n=1 Tax=Lolium multiflorum TaxID=4521 RepID=A0AAD8SM26_LOLMU|nr:hypothetical protein QYE76_048384 [Lolium multiflorum]
MDWSMPQVGPMATSASPVNRPPTVSARRRCQFTASRDGLLGFSDSPRATEHDGGFGMARGSPELTPSPVSIGDGIDLNFADSGDVLREKILKLAALRPSLDARLDQLNEDVEAHLLDHFLSSGVTSTVDFVLNSGGTHEIIVLRYIDEDIPTSLLPPSLPIEDEPAVKLKYEEETSIARGGEQLDVKLDKELDMKISHGRARGAGGMRERRRRSPVGQSDRPPRSPDSTVDRALTANPVLARLTLPRAKPDAVASDHKIVNQENKDSADIIYWREFEALRNEMRCEFRAQDDVLNGKVEEIKQTLDTTNETVTTMADQMTDIQRSLADMRLAIENLTTQQQDDDEDPELQDDAHNARGAPRGNRPRGWAPLGRNGRGQDEEDGLGKPKFSIPKFEGGADVEEYLTWELKIEKLWTLHPHYSEDRKIKLASSEFDGYALRWWDAFVSNCDEDGEQPIRTWRAMKEAMTSRFVPTNYLRNIFDKLTLLRQGVKTVDEYYMEMEMLMHAAWPCP